MRAAFAILLIACLALPAIAAEDGASRSDWSVEGLRVAKSMTKSTPDAFAASSQTERAPLMTLRPGASCGATEFEVCLDSTGRITVPGAKRFLPVLPGLTPERLTVKRSGLVFGYSF
jgi:hypothetical protein